MPIRPYTLATCGLWILAIALRVHNALSFPLDGTYDAQVGHIPYIQYVATHWRQPAPDASWEAWQPPLYYWISAILWTLAAPFSERPFDLFAWPQRALLPLFSSFLGLGVAAIAVAVVRRLEPGDALVHITALALVLFWPMHVVLAPWLRGDLLAALFTSVAVALLVGRDACRTDREALVLGTLVGLALLSKYTGVSLLVTAIVSVAAPAIEGRTRPRVAIRSSCLVVAAALLTSGWYYVRHWMHSGHFFLTSLDLVGSYHQQPGTRGVVDYVRFAPAVMLRPWVADPHVIRSVWAGTFATAWFDGHYDFLSHYMRRTHSCAPPSE